MNLRSSGMWRRVLVASCLLAVCWAQETCEGGDCEGEPFVYGDEPSDAPDMLHGLAWRVRHGVGHLQRSLDADRLVRARRWGNIANGVLLSTTGPVTLIVSLLRLRLNNAVLSMYISAVGAVLLGLELGLKPIAPWVTENMRFLVAPKGRTALLTFAGGLAWAFGRSGLLPGFITCVNAAFNAYFSHIVAFVQADDAEEAGNGADDGAAAMHEPATPEPTPSSFARSTFRRQRADPTPDPMSASRAAEDTVPADPVPDEPEVAAQMPRREIPRASREEVGARYAPDHGQEASME